jgi:hypothetical protein
MKRLSILVAMLAAVVAVAQEFRGTILGRVTDPGAATVGLAKVSVTNRATGIRSETSTNDAGDYYLPFLIPGSYDLRVEKAGFRAYVRTEIEVRTLDRLRLDVRMELGTFNESVTVTSENPLVTTVTADRGETVSGKMLADIPQNAHNALMLARLMPGVNGGARTFARVFDTGTTIDFGMSGGIRRRNEILLDGVNNTTSDFQVAHIPSADAVAEVRVQTNAYDAEYGRDQVGEQRISWYGLSVRAAHGAGRQQFLQQSQRHRKTESFLLSSWRRGGRTGDSANDLRRPQQGLLFRQCRAHQEWRRAVVELHRADGGAARRRFHRYAESSGRPCCHVRSADDARQSGECGELCPRRIRGQPDSGKPD